MKRIMVIIALAVACSAMYAEETQTQIAYRILGDYLRQQQSGVDNKIAGSIMMATGCGLVGLSAGSYFFGDQLTAALNDGDPWDEQTKYIVSGGLLASGLLTTTIGSFVYFARPQDPFAKYSEVFDETDPVVQEAMAAAAIRNIANEGREERMRNAFMDFAVPVVSLGVTGIMNASSGKPWYTGMEEVGRWNAWSIISGISTLCFEKSRGEKLYDKYMAARDAIYAGNM